MARRYKKNKKDIQEHEKRCLVIQETVLEKDKF